MLQTMKLKLRQFWKLLGISKMLNYPDQHVLKERNKLADYFANLTLDHNDVQVYSFGELDSKGRSIVNSDKLQQPYIRVRNAKPNPTC